MTSAAVRLPLGPHQSVDEVTYLDESRDTVTLDPSAYTVDNLDSMASAVLMRVDGKPWPRTVSVTFTAGYGDTEYVPAPIVQAILMHVAHMFENRESTTTLGFLKDLPHGYDDLIDAYRVTAF